MLFSAARSAADKPGFIASAFLADGPYHHHWGNYAGGTFEPASEEAARAGRTQVKMLERYPPEVNPVGWPRLVRRLAQGGGLPMEKTHTVMEEFGYTGSAYIGMALDNVLRQAPPEKKQPPAQAKTPIPAEGVQKKQ